MKIRVTLFASVLVVVMFQNSFSRQVIGGKGPFQLEVDIARFYGDSSLSYVEMYYGIHENMLTYKLDSGRYTGTVNMQWTVRNDSAIVANKEWAVPHTLHDTSGLLKSQTMMGIESVGLPVGDYTMTLLATDVNDASRKDSLLIPLRVTAYPPGKEAFSDIELCTSIKSSTDKKSIFYKNTLEVIPNASRLYGIGLPIMYYYTEAYNLNSASNLSNVVIHTAVIDAKGAEMLAKDKPKPRLHNSSVEIGTVNLSGLRGGTYLFRVSLRDSTKAELAFALKKFFVYKPGSVPDSTIITSNAEMAQSEFVIMTEQEVDQSFAYARYIASIGERQRYEKLGDLTAKQKFLFEFWRQRDPDPLTPVNEMKEDYLKRVEFAKEHLGGWRTDRGRIYILYGPYDEIERDPSSSESNPFETWHYNNLQGGVIFVFVDRNGLGDYLMVHSTHRDEIHDPDWFQRYAQKMR